MTMSNEEYLGALWSYVLFIFHHHPYIVTRQCNRNDNQNVLDALDSGSPANSKNHECNLVFGALQFLTGIGCEGSKCRSEDNIRSDPGSRKEDQSGWLAAKKERKDQNGREAVRVQVPKALRDLTSWTKQPKDLKPS